MKLRFALILLFLSSALAWADAPGTPALVLPFDEWLAKFPQQAAVLNLYPNFVEPTVDVLEYGQTKKQTIELMAFTSRTKLIANKSAVNVKLERLITEQVFKKMDPDAQHVRIQVNQTMPEVAGANPVPNFKWCNKVNVSGSSRANIILPDHERSLKFMQRPGTKWCTANSRTTCYESCRLVPPKSNLTQAILVNNSFKSPGKDYGMATQAELRYFVNEAEYGAKVPLASLTGIKTAVNGILEINIFYINQILLYGKMVIVLQPSPTDSQKTEVTGLTMFAVRSHAWNHRISGSTVQNLLRGTSPGFNIPTGIMAGAPMFSRSAVQSIVNVIENP